jgi:hypothetical protein
MSFAIDLYVAITKRPHLDFCAIDRKSFVNKNTNLEILWLPKTVSPNPESLILILTEIPIPILILTLNAYPIPSPNPDANPNSYPTPNPYPKF